MTGGEALRAVLDALHMPQSVFANQVGISAKHLNQLVKGHANFTPEMAVLIADAVALRLVTLDAQHRMSKVRQVGIPRPDDDGKP